MMTKLNVGCGAKTIDGYIGIDKLDFGQDIICDIEKQALLFNSNKIDEILCEHCLEHLNDPMAAINEFWRVLAPDGKLTIIVPHRKSDRAWVIDHKTYYDENSFDTLETHHQQKWKITHKAVNDRPDVVIELKPNKL